MDNIYDLASIYFSYLSDIRDYDLTASWEPTLENTSYYVEEDGETYFYYGDTCIKVTEHFSPKGKPIGALIENVVQHKVKNTL